MRSFKENAQQVHTRKEDHEDRSSSGQVLWPSRRNTEPKIDVPTSTTCPDFPAAWALQSPTVYLGEGAWTSLSSSSFRPPLQSAHSTLSSKQLFFCLISLTTRERLRARAGRCPHKQGYKSGNSLTIPHVTRSGHEAPHTLHTLPGTNLFTTLQTVQANTYSLSVQIEEAVCVSKCMALKSRTGQADT